MVGALLLAPGDSSCAAAVIFFNNIGYLGMCGHGTIGLMATLRHLGRISPGIHRIETPVGIVSAELHEDMSVSLRNVPSFRYKKAVSVEVPGYGLVIGDIAWGGNWFFLVGESPVKLTWANVEALTTFTWSIRETLKALGITGKNGEEIDHVEVFGSPGTEHGHSRNFVLCPGKAFDRSPCGTGTSAKLACLYEDAKLGAGQIWRQESIMGTIFEGWVEPLEDGGVIPTIRAKAYVNAEASLLIDPDDPFAWGMRNPSRT